MKSAHEMLELWGIRDAALTPVAQGANDVFRVEPGPYALRVQRCSLIDDATAASQLVWLQALAAQSGVIVPKPVPLPDGRPFVVRGDRRFVLQRDEACPIDFDEFGLGFYLSDVAEPLRVLVFRDDYPAMRRALLDAYRAQRPLSESHLDVFIAASFLATFCWAARPESATHRPEIEPWMSRWIQVIGKLCGISRA